MNKKYILPTPRSESYGELIEFASVAGDGFTLCIDKSISDSSASVKYIEASFNLKLAILPPYLGPYRINAVIDTDDQDLVGKGDEAYKITVNERETTLVALTEKGMYYAAISFAQLITVKGTKGYLRKCTIIDYPRFARRGVFIESRFNDFMTLSDWKSAVDYYSEMKLNTMVVGVYGCWGIQLDKLVSEYAYIPLESVPGFRAEKPEKYWSVKKDGWVNVPPRSAEMQKEDYLTDLIKYGKTKHVEVFPLFNSLGHNTLLPRIIPEISAKNSDGSPRKFGMCLSDPKTLEVMCKIHNEIIDKYLLPTDTHSIHLGLDEAVFTNYLFDDNGEMHAVSPVCDCHRCRSRKFEDLVVDYTVSLIKNAKTRGMKNVFIYHDAFVNNYPQELTGEIKPFNVLNEALEKRLKEEGIYDETVIDIWEYSAADRFMSGDKQRYVNCPFRKIIKPMSGYEYWTNFSDNIPNIECCAKLADNLNYEGIISYTTYEKMFDINYRYLSEAAWNPMSRVDIDVFTEKYFINNYRENYGAALSLWKEMRTLCRPYNYDKNYPSNNEFVAYPYVYVSNKPPYIRDFFGEVMKKIRKDPQKYLSYLSMLRERSEKVLEFCRSDYANPSDLNDSFILSMSNFNVASDIFLTLTVLENQAQMGTLTVKAIKDEIFRLICKQKKLMLGLENIRLSTTKHQHLRLATISLQYLEEYYDYFAAKNEFDICTEFTSFADITDTNSRVFEFLR